MGDFLQRLQMRRETVGDRTVDVHTCVITHGNMPGGAGGYSKCARAMFDFDGHTYCVQIQLPIERDGASQVVTPSVVEQIERARVLAVELIGLLVRQSGVK